MGCNPKKEDKVSPNRYNENATIHNLEGNTLSTKDYITMLLDMEDVVLKNMQEDEREITIAIELRKKEH